MSRLGGGCRGCSGRLKRIGRGGRGLKVLRQEPTSNPYALTAFTRQYPEANLEFRTIDTTKIVEDGKELYDEVHKLIDAFLYDSGVCSGLAIGCVDQLDGRW